MDYSDRMLRRAIEKLPDGTYEAEGHIDGFVDHPDPAYRDLTIKVAAHRRGLRDHGRPDRDRAAGRPADQHAARRHGRHRDLGDAALDPARRGARTTRCRRTRACSGAITIVAPEGCIANPTFPAPTIARFCGGQHHRRHGHARPRAGPARGRQRGRRQPQGRRVLRLQRRPALGLHGHPGGQLRRPPRQGRDRRRRHALREHAQQPDRGHRVALPAAGHAVRAARGRAPAPAAGAAASAACARSSSSTTPAARSRATATSGRRPASSAASDGTPGSVILNRGTDREQQLPSKFPYRKAATGDRLCLIVAVRRRVRRPARARPRRDSRRHRRRIREPRVGSRTSTT